jgi:hypothetical protein
MAAPLDRIVFARRQSPDWAGLAADFGAGRVIDPRRYVPDHAITGFPANIVELVAAWNATFQPDFFTCRAMIAALSAQNIASVQGGVSVRYDDFERIAALASESRFLLFFHDDDDFFAPDMLARLTDMEADVCVFPLIRVFNQTVTYVREGEAAEMVCGARSRCFYRYHSNNYGMSSRICTPATLRGLKDHMDGSDFADRAGLSDVWVPYNVSATVKTPCSASILGGLLNDKPAFTRQMSQFAAMFAASNWPARLAWLGTPVREIGALFARAAALTEPTTQGL